MERNKIIKKSISIPVDFLQYSILIYFIILHFQPSILQPVNSFTQPFMGVIIVLYTILITITAILLPFSAIVLYLATYTNKFDSKAQEPGIPLQESLVKWIFNFIKGGFLVYLSYSLDYKYLAIIISLQLLFSLYYKFVIEREYVTKTIKRKLAWQETDKSL